jgi:hypothetical protein
MKTSRWICLGLYSLTLAATLGAATALAEAVQWSMTVDANSAGLWLFREGTGTTSACEAAGKPAATLSNAAWVPGRNYFAVASNPGYVTIADNSAFRPSTAITVEMWVKLERPTGDLVCKNMVYMLRLGTTITAEFYVDGAWRIVTGSQPIPLGQWGHLAMTYHRDSSTTGTVALYINGALDTSQQFTGLTTGNLSQETYAIYLGENSWSPAGGSEVDGKFDSFRISNIARTFDPLLPQTAMGIDSSTTGLWRFKEGSGTTSADEITGGPAATLSTGTTWISGQDYYAISFNGSNVQIPDNVALRPATAITVEAWAKLNAAGGDLVTKNMVYQLRLNGGVVTAAFCVDGVWRSVTGNLPVPVGRWTHLAITYQQNSSTAGTISIYVDGQLDMSQTIYGLTTGLVNQGVAALWMGQNSWNPSGSMVNGSIDTLRISNVARHFTPLPPPASTVANLVPNGNFEGGLLGWRLHNEGDANLVWEILTSGMNHGLRCLHMIPSATLPGGLGSQSGELISRPIPVVPGGTYTLSRYVKADATCWPNMNVYAIGTSLTSISPFPTYPTVTTSWTQQVQSFTVPSTCTSVCVALPYMSSGQLYVDDVRLQYAGSAQPLVLQDMISVAPATVPVGHLYTYTSGTTTGITLNMINTDTVAHSTTVVAMPYDWQGTALTPVTVGTFNLGANSLTTTTYQLPTNLRGAFRLGFKLTAASQTWQQLAQYKYAVFVDLTNVGSDSTSVYGMNAHLEREPGAHATENMSVLAKCGVKLVRPWWGWGMCEATQGTFDFTEYDRQYNAITSGTLMKPMPNVQRYIAAYEASWAGPVTSGSYSQYPYTSVLPEWEVFVGNVAQHFGGNIGRYELWNEPEIAHPTPVTAAQYATLLNDTRPYIIAKNPNAAVIAFAGASTTFIANVLALGVASQMDRVSDHPYGQAMRPEVDQPKRVSDLRATMTAGGLPANTMIWDSEVGIFGDGDGYLPPSISEADIAALYTRNVVTAKSLGIGKYFWFAAQASPQYGFGTYYEDYTPRPRLMALNATASFLEGLGWQTKYQPSGTSIYAHMYNGTIGACVLWSTSGPAQVTLAIAASKLSAFDTMGNAITVTGSTTSTVNIPGERPVFLTCASTDYSTLNTAVGGMTVTNTAVTISYTKNSSTSLTVTVTNQCPGFIDGIMHLIPSGSPSPWPADMTFDSLASGESRSFTFTFTGGVTTVNLSQIQAKVGDMSMQAVTINYTGG